jgi:hypothetical protein
MKRKMPGPPKNTKDVLSHWKMESAWSAHFGAHPTSLRRRAAAETCREPAIKDLVADLAATIQASLDTTELRNAVYDVIREIPNAAFTTFISFLGVEGIEVIKPIPITVRPDGDEFVASFFDANISTGAETAQEAISNLQSLIADMFIIHEDNKDPLGSAMKSQQRVLMESLCRTSQKISQKTSPQS